MGKRRTHEEFVQEMQIVNPNIEILGMFKNMKTKIKCRCKVDKYEWESAPLHLINNTGCPMCAGNIKKTHKQFINDIKKINPNIKIIGTYKNARTPLLCRCEIDGYEWMAFPTNLLKNIGCPICGYKNTGIKLRKSYNDYIKECELLGFDVIDEYQNGKISIMHKCKKCGTEFNATPNHVLSGHTGCPKCLKSKSKAEWAITDILDSHGINFNPEYTVNINNHSLRYDFWLPDYNCFIEYDGEDHFKPIPRGGMTMEEAQVNFEQRQLYDKWKDEYCEQNNIGLLRIQCPTPFEEFENIIFDYLKGGPDYGQKIY